MTVEREGELRAALIDVLRSTDEVVLLPGASRSEASLTYKNVLLTLDGAAGHVAAATPCIWPCINACMQLLRTAIHVYDACILSAYATPFSH